MNSSSGTYALVLKSETGGKVEVGKLGTFLMPEGFYVYTGSAFGPGGLESRVGRHLQRDKSTHWHIDYIAQKTTPVEVWYNTGGRKLECMWSGIFKQMEGRCPSPGFGSSDCHCLSHLFHFKIMPNFDQFRKIAKDFVKRERL